MHKLLLSLALMVGLWTPAFAQAPQPKEAEAGFELPKLGRLTTDMTVTVKSKGGKYLVLATLKNFAAGELKVPPAK